MGSMRRIFITSVGGDVGNAILRVLSGEPDTFLFGCDIKDYVPDMQLMKYYIAPRYGSPNYWPYIREILLSLQITHFIPVSEPELIIFDKYRSFFQQHHIGLVMNDSDVIHTFCSKYKTARFLVEHGISAPRTYLPEKLPTGIAYPLIVKPDTGRGSNGVHLVNSDEELQVALKNTPHAIVQEYIGSPEEEYTMGIFSNGQLTHHICFKRTLGYGSMSVRVSTVSSDDIDRIAQEVSHALNLKGAINVQMRKQKGKYFIFEINPRLSSTVGFRHKLGFTDVLWWLDVIDHKSIVREYRISNNIIGLRCLNEQIVNLDQ